MTIYELHDRLHVKRAVRAGDWPLADGIADYLSVQVTVAA